MTHRILRAQMGWAPGERRESSPVRHLSGRPPGRPQVRVRGTGLGRVHDSVGSAGGRDDATALIHQTSRGYPRAVNNLALQALVAAFAADKAIVDESSTRAAVAEVTAD